LQNSKITIVLNTDKQSEKIKPLLFLGKQYKYKIPPPIHFFSSINIPTEIYVSYKDELVGLIELKSWYKIYQKYMVINYIYLTKENDTVVAKYVINKKGRGFAFGATLIPKEEFYQKYNVAPKDIGKYELLFFNKFPPYWPTKNVYLKDLETKENNLTDRRK